jgi:GT2 family glycosyltransferase
VGQEEQLHDALPVPVVCVIIPAYRSWATLPRVLDALESQIDARRHEVVVVENSGDHSAHRLEQWPWVRVIELAQRTLPGRGRNLAIASTDSELLAFLDADSVPDRGWLERLTNALSVDVDAVVGTIRNGTPRSPTGTAQYFLEFSDWLPGGRTTPIHAPTCNLLVRKAVLLRAGGFPEDLWPGEDTVVTVAIARAGRLGVARDASVCHLNRTGWREFIRHQRRLGAAYVEVCQRADFPHPQFGRPAMAPLAVLLRLGALGIRVIRTPRLAARALLVSPWIVAGAVAWGAGIVRPGENFATS